MIEVKLVRALSNFSLGKNRTFKEGNLYFLRTSKCGQKLVLRGEEGYWQTLHKQYRHQFRIDGLKTEKTIYMRNRKRLNEFESVQEYLDGDSLKSSNWMWYDSYADKNLW